MKNILITGGPTSEPIDEIMRIITFSTGSLSLELTKIFLENGHSVTLVAHDIVDTKDIENHPNLILKKVMTTVEMMDEIHANSEKRHYDALLHTAAVGDYLADFPFLMEDLAEEIYDAVKSGKADSAEAILNILKNPDCKLDDSSKISSYQENLTVKLGLTPKIIESLRGWFPDTLLIGCKLLDKVSQEELFEVATKLCIKNDMDYIMANDLAELAEGNKTRYLVNKDGYTGRGLDTTRQICNFVESKID